jgi:hypothetical protein
MEPMRKMLLNVRILCELYLLYKLKQLSYNEFVDLFTVSPFKEEDKLVSGIFNVVIV